MYADGTGLLTYAMHDGRGAGRFPSRRRMAAVESVWLTFIPRWAGSMRESQLRGSGGVSPRFPSIPNRDKVLGRTAGVELPCRRKIKANSSLRHGWGGSQNEIRSATSFTMDWRF